MTSELILSSAFALLVSACASTPPSSGVDAATDSAAGADTAPSDAAPDSTTEAGPGKGFDCIALRDWQLASNCPKFDGTKYLVDCAATKASIKPSCVAAADALANCLLAQPSPACKSSGSVDDTIPAPCKAAEATFLSCP